MRGALAVALALAVAVGACGGDTKTKNAYVEKVNNAQSQFVSVVDESGTSIQSNASDAQTAMQLDKIRQAAASLVKEAQGLAAAFKKAADAYRSQDPSQILTAKVDLTNDIDRVNKQLNATITQLNTKLH